MTVRGMRMKPAKARAVAPARRFAVFESSGREEEWRAAPSGVAAGPVAAVVASGSEEAACWRMVLREVK